MLAGVGDILTTRQLRRRMTQVIVWTMVGPFAFTWAGHTLYGIPGGAAGLVLGMLPTYLLYDRWVKEETRRDLFLEGDDYE